MKTLSRFISHLGVRSFLPAGVLLASLLFLVAPAFAAENPVNISVHKENSRTVIDYTFGPFSSTPIVIDGRECLTVKLGKESPTFDKGFPALPHVSRSVIVPNDSRPGIEVVSSHYRDIAGVSISPSKGIIMRTVRSPADVPYTFGPFYEKNAWYPEKVAVHGQPYIMRDLRGMVITVNPFQYNPAKKVLRVYDRVTVRVVDEGTGAGAPAPVNVLPKNYRKPSRAFQSVQSHHFINYNGNRYPPMNENGELLIITYDSFNSHVQPLATWKNSIGITTTVVDVSTIGNNATSIKNYIQQFYNSHNLSFVLLVGDGPQVQPPMVGGDAADPTYALLAGNDHYPDIFVGRFSAETTAQVDTQVQRTIEYEQMSHTEPWFWKGTGIASDQGPGHHGEYDWQHMDLIRDDLLAFGYTKVDQIYDPNASASQVTAALNEGRGILNYCGHGSTTSWGTTGFSNSNVNALQNNNMLPFITSVACLNGNFYYSTCFAEAWLRATHNGEPTGAIGMYASTVSQSWSPPMEAQDEFIDRYCDYSYNTFGGLCFAGASYMMDVWGSAGRTEFDHWTVFGDPSLSVRGTGGGAFALDFYGSDYYSNIGVPPFDNRKDIFYRRSVERG